MSGLWLFVQYKTGRNTDKISGLIGFRFFMNHERMKLYSAKVSAKFRKKYPDYCSTYWKLV